MPGLISHSDRGSQYASKSHRKLLEKHGIKQSLSKKDDCWDHAVVESFFHTLKVELLHQQNFKAREQPKQTIFEYIECYYNRIKMHTANDDLAPNEFEKIQMAA